MKNTQHLTIIAFMATALLCSCGNKTLLDDTRTFANDTWMRFTPEHFDIHATSTDDCYNFNVTLTIDTARYRETALPIMIEMQSPEHEKRTLFSTILFRNHEGSWLGSFDDNGLLTVTQTVRQFYFFNTTGTHSLDLSQRTHRYEIHGIKSLNLNITKAKLEYPE